MRLADLVEIDNRFEKSVNLLLDLFVQDKIDGYIPTRSSVKILGEYINEIQQYSGNRASVLIGPYGKGKSHLLLVLLTILSQSCQISALNKLVQRIDSVNESVAHNIKDVISNNGTFLPVIINAGAGTLNQAFMKGLTNALIRDDLDDVVPDNYYSEAIKMIHNWEENFPDTFKAFNKKIGKKMVPAFIKSLSHYDESALQTFQAIYPALTSGGHFNPVVDNEVISVYRSVNRILREKHGYAGIYIVFDEFSKYIEGHPVDRFAEDMKILQDMCELCNASKDEQLHLTCVAHKSIKAYGNTLPQEVLNAFKGVEGRLKEVYFVVSSQNNYELISDAITKLPAFQQWAHTTPAYLDLVDETYTLKSFSSLFTSEDYHNIVGQGCFPLTPVAAMLLLNLSEKIAQNERTIFTYITSKDKAGLARCVEKNKTATFIGVNSVYDYFVPLLREDTAAGVHHEWLKADYALSKTDDATEQAILKSLAVIHMVNRPDEIATTEKYIALATGLEKNKVHNGLARLSEKKLIELKDRTKTYEFKNNIGVDVEMAIADVTKKRFMKVDVCSVLSDIIKEKCILPKKHNMQYCMTRYFNYAYMTPSQFMKMKDASYLEWPNHPDGVIVMLVPGEDIDEADIEHHTKEIDNPCMAVCLPNSSIDCTDKVRYLLAVKSLLTNSSFVEDNLVIKKELDNLIEETVSELNSWVKSVYFPPKTVYGRNGKIAVGKNGLNRLISDMCDAAYPNTPIINHELINRHEITSQILRARTTIFNDLINGRDTSTYETGTSAESTIFRATMIHPKNDEGLRLAKSEIDTFVNSCINKKISFESTINRLMAPPYGMRKGVIAFYLLDSLLRLENMPIIYLNNKEVVFEVETINNILKKPGDYFLYVEKETVQKNEYVHGLEALFNDFSEYCRDVDKRNQLAKISCMMQSWYRSLPQASMTFTVPDYEGQDIKKVTAFRKLFTDLYLNPRDILFERIPKIFKADNLKDTLSVVKDVKKDIDAHIHHVKNNAACIIRDSFNFSSDADLRRCLLTWYEELPDVAKNSIFTTRTTALVNFVKTVQTNDDEEIAGKIVYATTGMFIEDWKNGFSDKFKEELDTAIDEVASKTEDCSEGTQKILLMDEGGKPVEKYYNFNPENLSPTVTFFKSALDDMMEEYDGILEDNEKIGVLMNAIKKLMK